MTPQEFESSLKQGKISPVWFIYGEESFLVDRAVRALLDRAVDPTLRDFNYNVFYGNESKGIDIIDAAQTLPMFADRRAVLVKRAEALSAAACDVLLPYIQNPAPDTCLVLTGTKIDQRKKFFVELKKNGNLVEFKRIYDNKLGSFIQNESVAQGKPIEPAAADLLSLLIGNNLQELSSQIEKLIAYSGPRQKISLDDVRVMASSSKAYSAFELARYLGMKDLQNALKSLDTLQRNGEESFQIMGALIRHFRQLWRVRELLDRKVAQPEICRETGIAPFFAGEIIQQAKNFSTSDLRKIFSRLYDCDIGSKSGENPYTLMHGLVCTICSNL